MKALEKKTYGRVVFLIKKRCRMQAKKILLNYYYNFIKIITARDHSHMISARKKTRGFCYILFYFAFLTKVYCFFSNKWRGVKFLYFLTIPYYHIINNLLKRWLRNIREFPQKPKHLSMIRITLPCNFLRLHDRKNVFLEISQFLRKHLSICNIPKSSILLCSAKNFFTRYKLFSVCQCRHGREGIPSTNGR